MRALVYAVMLGLTLLAGDAGMAQTLKLFGLADAVITLDRAGVEAAGTTDIKIAREITVNGAAERQETVFTGVSLPKLLDAHGFDKLDRYAVRSASIIVTSHDGYKAGFSWGELFNAPAGHQVLLILKENGAPLPARAGAFTMRALGDARPGPRHVRDVAEIRIVLPQ